MPQKTKLAQSNTKSFDQYLSELDTLLKRSTGTGLYQGQDVSSNTPMYIPGRVVNPSGIGESAPSIMQYGNGMTAPEPVQRAQRMEYIPEETPGWQRQTDPGARREAIQNPAPVTSEQAQQSYQTTGQVYGVASMQDGGILYSDGLIRYDDGTVREYTGVSDAYAFRSNEDGSIGYSDGSSRRPATREELNIQGQPEPIMSLEGGRVLYSDGLVRDYVPGSFTPQNPQAQVVDNGVVNFFDKFGQGYTFQPQGYNDLTGQCAWFSQQITTLPDGNSWRIGNTIEQKKAYLDNYAAGGMAFYPGQDTAQVGNSIVFDEGTQYGHVATISEVFQGQDGRTYYRLTESNYAAPNMVTHDRVVSADDQKIVGVLRTQPREGYTLKDWTQAPEITGERTLAVQNNASQTGEQERQGEDAPIDRQAQLPPASYDQSGGKYNAPMSPAPQVLGASTEQYQQPQTPLTVGNIPQLARETAQNVSQGIEQANPTGPYGVGLTELLTGDTQGARQELAKTIESTGLSQGLITPEAAQTRLEAVKQEAPTAQYNPYRQLIGNVIERVGDVLGVPEGVASEFTAGGPTKRTNVAMASEIGGTQPQAVPGIRQNIADIGADIKKNVFAPAAQNVGEVVGKVKTGIEDIGEKIEPATEALAKAGQGIQTLGQSGIDALSNVFKPKVDTAKRAVGDVTGTTGEDNGAAERFTSLMDTASSMANLAKNDVRDPFFKMGGSEMYKTYLKPNAQDIAGGALTMDLFTPDFYKDLGRISSVFGGSKDLNPATEKYVAYEQEKYKPMSRMNYEEGYDRGEIDNYNKEVDKYNQGLNDYFNQIRSSVKGQQSIFTPLPSSSQRNIFASSTPVPVPVGTPVGMSSPSFNAKFAVNTPAKVTSFLSANASLARPTATPQKSFAAPVASAARPTTSGGFSSSNSSLAPRPTPAPAPTPARVSAPVASAARPTVSGGFSSANSSLARPAPKPAPAPTPSRSSGTQSKPKSNVFSNVVSAIKNIFRW